jgi:hypothetical protein
VALIAVAGGFMSPATASPEGVAVLKKYDVVINGMTTTLLLSDEDAAARGLHAEAPVAKSRVPANKAAAKPANKRASAATEAFRPKADKA